MHLKICSFLILFFIGNQIFAQPNKTAETTQKIPDPKSFMTKHSLEINGELVNYQVTGEELYLKDKNDKLIYKEDDD